MLVGENGIITQAQRADELTTQAQQKEAIELAVASVQAQGTLELDRTKLETALQSQLRDTEYTLTENGDGSFLLQIAERSYYIDSTGEVIAEENMIAIGSAEELKAFRDDVNNGNTYEGKYVYLTSDITLDINEQWEPIGILIESLSNPETKAFSGIFDGKNNEIDGIYINTTDKAQGLFGVVNDGIIKNLGVGENCNIIVNESSSAVVGRLYNDSYAYNCWNRSNLTISNGYSGGVFGIIEENSKVQNCYNLGDITITADEGNTTYGGISGSLTKTSQMYNCYNKGRINISNTTVDYVGGIVGRTGADCLIEGCFNNGQVEGNENIGGIAGFTNNNSVLQNCYNTGGILGTIYIGGIIGKNDGKSKNCYNIGSVSGETVERYGGIVGANNSYSNIIGELKNCYSLVDTCENGIGFNINNAIMESCEVKSEEDMKNLAQILGSAFKEDTNNINNGYPVLRWQ